MSTVFSFWAKVLSSVVLVISLNSTLSYGQESLNCQDSETLAQLDFWLGNWIVQDEEGNRIGTNSISRILNGCAIEERWLDTQGNLGQSWFFISPESRSLKQIWLTTSALNPGGTKEKEVIAFEMGQSIQFQGSYPARNIRVNDRTTLTRVSNDRVIQKIEISTDGAETWQTNFVGIYIRRE